MSDGMRLLLIYERSSHWTAELERLFSGRDQLSIRWRPHKDDFLNEALDADTVLIVADGSDAELGLIRHLRQASSVLGIGCLVSNSALNWEWLARELGADFVLPETTEIQRVAWSVERLIRSAATKRFFAASLGDADADELC
jgi:hypothetical protein